MAKKKRIHPSVTAERVMELCERRNNSLDNPRNYFCEEHRVYGCEEALLMLLN